MRMWNNWNSRILLVKMQNGKAIVENKHLAYIPAIPLLVIKTSGMKIYNPMQNTSFQLLEEVKETENYH